MNKKILPSFPWDILIEWYTINGRHYLPWRDYNGSQEERGYRVWLSEILLQQTQVDRVIPYFEKILEKYPSIHDLRKASYEEFFSYYQGMGYYSRARNILKTAHIISTECGGIFPREKKSLMTLPGVGGYTASAILAFGYGEPYLAWDTNLEKVFARYYNGRKDTKLTEEQKEKIENDFREFLNSPHKNGEGERVIQKMNSFSVTPPNLPFSGEGGKPEYIRAINNALMDFASMIDLKNPENIDWENYIFKESLFYKTRGELEPKEQKKTPSFPVPDATIIVILHRDHRVYYAQPSSLSVPLNDEEKMRQEYEKREIRKVLIDNLGGNISYILSHSSYLPFLLAPSLSRDTRTYVQEYFRKQYNLELSVRPVHKKWLSKDGKPYIAVNAQVQVGDVGEFRKFNKTTLRLE